MQERLQATIPNSNKWHTEDVEARAKALGMEKSEFVLKAVDMMMNFDEIFIKKIQGFAEGLHIPEWLVMQNMIIKRMADEAAEGEVYGGGTRLLDEFMLVGDGEERRSITGGELFDILRKQYIVKYEKKMVDQALDDEKWGRPISEKEKELLIKYRVGQTWLNSEEYQKELEREKQFKEIMDKYPDAVEMQAGYMEEMKASLKESRNNK